MRSSDIRKSSLFKAMSPLGANCSPPSDSSTMESWAWAAEMAASSAPPRMAPLRIAMADDLSRLTTRACPSRYTCACVDIIRMDDADRADLFLNRIGAAVFDFIRLIRVVYSAIPVIGRYRVRCECGIDRTKQASRASNW